MHCFFLEVTGAVKSDILSELGLPASIITSTKVFKQHCSKPGDDSVGIDTKNMCTECQYEIQLPAK